MKVGFVARWRAGRPRSQGVLTAVLLGLLLLAAAIAPARAARGAPAFSTLLGGALSERAHDVAVDAAGAVYVVGQTESLQFPALPGGAAPLGSGAPLHGVDAFVAKLSADGGTLEYVFWFNAAALNAIDQAFALAVDAAGAAYVTGYTRSADFCSLFGGAPGYDTSYNDSGDAFVLKIRPDGSGMDYCTFLGGSDWDQGNDLVLDGSGGVVVTGLTWSTDFPTTTLVSPPGGSRDLFVARLDAAGMALTYATRLGGSGQDEARAVALDGSGRILVGGWTRSADFPTTPGAYAAAPQGDFDGFALALTADGTALAYATYVGGSGEDRVWGLAADAAGVAHLGGTTLSADLPATPGALDETANGDRDGFVLGLAADGQTAVYATYLGGRAADEAWDVALDGSGRLIVAGETASDDFLGLAGRRVGAADAFVLRLAAAAQQLTDAVFLGGTEADWGTAVVPLGAADVRLAGATTSADFPTTPGAYDPTPNGAYDAFVAALAWNGLPAHRLYLPLIAGR